MHDPRDTRPARPIDRLPARLSDAGEHEGRAHAPDDSERPTRALAERDADRAYSEENTTRELYAQLINMLSQEPGAKKEPARSSPLDGVWTTLRRRWIPMLVAFVVAMYGLSQYLRPRQTLYTSTVTMLLPPLPAARAATSLAPNDGSDTVARQYDTEAQIAIITSPRIVARAMAKLKSADRKRGWGSDKARSAPVSASSSSSESLIDISVTGLDPGASKRLANTVGGIYIRDTYERTTQAREQDLRFVREKAAQTRRQLDKAQRDLREYKERTGVFDLNSQVSASGTRLQELQAEAQAARIEAAAGLGADAAANDATLNTLRQRAAEARITYENLARDFVPTAPRVQAAALELSRAESAADERAASLLSNLQRKAASAEEQLAQARRTAATLPATEFRLKQLNGEAERLASTYSDISARLGALNLARNAYVAVPSYVRPATVEGPSRSQKVRYLAVSALGALIVSALTGLLLNRLDRSVHSARDLQSVAAAPILGVLPALSGSVERRLTHMTSEGARANMLEASFALRSRLVEAAYKNGVRSILITSATTDEGKSLCALNVAAALAYDGHRVMLIDSDFWNPTQHHLANLDISPGYSDVLLGQATLEEATHALPIRNLWVLPSGGRPSNIISLMNGEANREHLRALSKSFDFVIIDSPPTLSLADAQILASLADSVALVVADSTSSEQIQRAQAALRLTGAHILGVILNKDKSNSRDILHRNSTYTRQADAFQDYEKRLERSGRQPAPLDR
jgi:capsular exopolysaccharide synthesis family protein